MKRNISLGLILLLLIGLIIWLLTLAPQAEREQTPRDEAIEESDGRPDVTMNTKHQYKDGEHMFVGYVETPTPCNKVNAEVIEGDMPEIRVTIQELGPAETCIAQIATQEFRATYESDNPDLKFRGTLNGEDVALNMFEVDAEEDIDSVEIFIKG